MRWRDEKWNEEWDEEMEHILVLEFLKFNEIFWNLKNVLGDHKQGTKQATVLTHKQTLSWEEKPLRSRERRWLKTPSGGLGRVVMCQWT